SFLPFYKAPDQSKIPGGPDLTRQLNQIAANRRLGQISRGTAEKFARDAIGPELLKLTSFREISKYVGIGKVGRNKTSLNVTDMSSLLGAGRRQLEVQALGSAVNEAKAAGQDPRQMVKFMRAYQ